MIISRVVYDSRLRGYSVMTRALTYTDLFKQSRSHTTLAHRPDITTTTTYTIIAQITVSFIVSLSCAARRGHMIIADSAKAVHGRWYITTHAPSCLCSVSGEDYRRGEKVSVK